MATPYTPWKRKARLAALAGLGWMVAGYTLARGPFGFFGAVLAVYGCIAASRNVALLIRLAAAEDLLLREKSRTPLEDAFRRASLPRKVFVLLCAVAEVDGRAGDRERDLVRRFLLERFQRPDLHEQIRTWRSDPIPPAQLDDLVHELRAMLTRSECDTIFAWCCMVALIDQSFNATEHELLQRIARHLGLPAHHARRVFLQAKNRVLGAEQRPPRRSGGTTRGHALEVLGLDAAATHDEIKKRHRELVKKYHPDAHSHLGPVAAEEATERFREIQSAYETLTG